MEQIIWEYAVCNWVSTTVGACYHVGLNMCRLCEKSWELHVREQITLPLQQPPFGLLSIFKLVMVCSQEDTAPKSCESLIRGPIAQGILQFHGLQSLGGIANCLIAAVAIS